MQPTNPSSPPSALGAMSEHAPGPHNLQAQSVQPPMPSAPTNPLRCPVDCPCTPHAFPMHLPCTFHALAMHTPC